MARKARPHVCSECGARTSAWMGFCPTCGNYGTLTPLLDGAQEASLTSGASVRSLADVDPSREKRLPTGFTELDRLTGGGWVAGSIALLAGEPGIGKSTLTLQCALRLTTEGRDVLLAAGEEGASRIRERARRLGGEISHLFITEDREIEGILEAGRRLSPHLLIVDSIQSMHLASVEGLPGRPSQIDASAKRLAEAARTSGIPILMTGHVTKGDELAGPRSLEHEVDQVLYLEGQRQRELRWLRSVKNRFGPTFDVAVLRMGEMGLEDVADPSALLLGERPTDVPGSVVAPVVEGSRVLLVEVQALVGPARFSTARLRCRGVASERAEMVSAVLERRLGLPLHEDDIFLNVVGGLDIAEPGIDLPVAAAITSALLGRPIPEGTAVAGEIGLASELRSVTELERRRTEAARSGYSRLLAPGPSGPNTVREALIRMNLTSSSESGRSRSDGPRP